MINDYRFFQDFYDGQIIKEDSERYKMFKLLLFSFFSVAGLFLMLSGFCNGAEFLLLEMGMIWNFYTGLSKKVGMVLCVLVSALYAFFASNFLVYANALIYPAFYISFQLFALCKDYSQGDFVQIKKRMTDYNYVLFAIFFVLVTAAFFLFDTSLGARFIIFDSFSAALLLSSAILRNERYREYYLIRIIALSSSILLWILISIEYGTVGTLAIILMYASYLIFDIVTYFVQVSTYVNEYMIQVEKYKKIEEQLVINKKLNDYNKLKVEK